MATYYVDSSITDTNVASATPDFTTYNPATFATTGGSASVYKTIADVNAKTFAAGDSVLFRKGQTWRELLTIPSSGSAGNPVTYGSFGSGVAPTIKGSDLKVWIQGAGGADPTTVWHTSLADDPFAVYFNGVTGTPVASIIACNAAGKWFWNDPTNTLYVYGPTDPAAVVEVPMREYCIVSNATARHYITISDLHLKNASYYNLRNSSGDHWVISGCLVDRVGHAGLLFENNTDITVTQTEIAYTNQLGVTAGHEALSLHNVTTFSVTECHVHDCMEDGIVAKYGANNGVILRNLVYNCGAPGIAMDAAHDIECAYNRVYGGFVISKPGISIAVEHDFNPLHLNTYNIKCHHNVVSGCGAGIWIYLETGADAYADLTNIKIYNNTLTDNNDTDWGGIVTVGVGDASNIGTGCEIRNNIIYDNTDNVGAKAINDFRGMMSAWTITHNLFGTGEANDAPGTNAVTGNPLFTNAGAGDYSLQSGSPAIDAGVDLGDDYDAGLDASTVWPLGVVFADQDDNGAGWEIGAFVWLAPHINDAKVVFG